MEELNNFNHLREFKPDTLNQSFGDIIFKKLESLQRMYELRVERFLQPAISRCLVAVSSFFIDCKTLKIKQLISQINQPFKYIEPNL